MSQLAHALTRALRGMRSGLLIQLAATGAIAVGLLLTGLAGLGATNLDRITAHWGRGIQVVAYLKPEADPERVRALAQLLRARPQVLAVRQLAADEAFRRLEESLGAQRGLLAGVERDFLPASLEISLADRGPEQARPLIALLSASPLVEEVDDLGAWARRLDLLARLLRLASLGIALVIGCACLYIVGSTIRLGVFARREEIEILKLVGATDRFVRAPFLLEGALQGLLGALIATGGLYVIYRAVAPHVEATLTSALAHLQLAFLSPALLAAGLAGGALLGFLGSRLALGRYLDV